MFGSSESEHCVHCHTMSQLVLTAFLYCCLVTRVTPVLHVRCCHLLHPSHSSPSWHCVTSWLQEIHGYICSVFIVSNNCYEFPNPVFVRRGQKSEVKYVSYNHNKNNFVFRKHLFFSLSAVQSTCCEKVCIFFLIVNKQTSFHIIICLQRARSGDPGNNDAAKSSCSKTTRHQLNSTCKNRDIRLVLCR